MFVFGEKQRLEIDGKGEYNEQFHGLKAWMVLILKFMTSKN